MKIVIREYMPDPYNPVVVGTVEFENGEVLIGDCADWLRDSLEQRGAVSARGDTVFPEAGVDFMNAVLFTFKSAYLRAEIAK